MKLVNIVYEYDDITNTITVTDSVDIIRAPDSVCDNIDDIVQEFFDWIALSENRKEYENEEKTLCFGTNEFVKWLNEKYIKYGDEKIAIVETNKKYNPNYPSAWF